MENVTNVALTQLQKETTFNFYLTEILFIHCSQDKSGNPALLEFKSLKLSLPNVSTAKQNARRAREMTESEDEDEDGKTSKKQKLLV